MTKLGLVAKNLIRRPLRTAVLAISVGITVLVLTVTTAATRRISEVLGGFDPNRVSVTYNLVEELPYSAVDFVRHVPGVQPDSVEWVSFGGAAIGENLNIGVWAVSNGFPATFPRSLYSVTDDVDRRWREKKSGLLVTEGLLKKAGWHVGQAVAFDSSFGRVEGEIIGAVTGHLEDSVFAHYEYLDVLRGAQSGRIQRVSARCDHSQIEAVITAIDEHFAATPTPTLTVPEPELHGFFMHSASAIPQLLWQIAIIMLLVTVVVCATTLSLSLRERRREFATLRAIGFTPGLVAGVILGEMLATCVLAALLGSVLPFILFHERGIPLGQLSLESVQIGLDACIAGTLLSLAIGVVVSLWPSIHAARVDVVSALAQE